MSEKNGIKVGDLLPLNLWFQITFNSSMASKGKDNGLFPDLFMLYPTLRMDVTS